MFSMTAIRFLKVTILAMLFSVLVGCGGGGGGGGSSKSAKDTTPPVITILGDNPTTLVVNTDTYTDAGATATDAVDGAVEVTSTSDVDTSVIGSYSVTYTATDKAGNSATATRTVEVLEYKEASVSILQGLTELTLQEGEQKSFTFVVDFTDGTDPTYLIELTHLYEAAGFSLSSSGYPDTGWEASDDKQWTVNVTLTALTAGEYILTSRVTLTETGEVIEVTLPITIIAADSMMLTAPGPDKDAIAPGSAEEVVFTSKVIGGSDVPATLSLNQVDSTGAVIGDSVDLLDDGVGEDLVAGDLVYTGTVSIPESTVGELYFQTSADDVESEISKVSVTEFPTTIAASDPSSLIEDDDGNQIYSNELLVKFVDGVSAARIEEIITTESASASIVGTVMSLDIYQVQLEAGLSLASLEQMIQALEAYGEVEFADYSAQTSVDAFPNDTNFAEQSNMTTIRADEAWYVSNGDTFISMIDTGVDYLHTELDSKVVQGKDFVDVDDDPMDTDGHGTHVAGIVAAKANNEDGIAGLSWNSKIIAVRGVGGSYAALVAAIRYSADRGSKVINISGGAYVDSDSLNSATAYAESKSALVVSTAGNDGLNEPRYPCYYDSVLCVGNATNTNGRASSSNFGDWIDIAAPGEEVPSTQLGGGIVTMSGTSMAASLTSGAAAMVWTQHPEWTAEKIRSRLTKSGKTLADGLLIGSTRLDVFEAVFNGSFEIGDLSEWQVTGTASSITQLSSILPVAGNKMALVSTGGGVETTMTKLITIQPGVTELPIEFTYNFLSSEYPEYIGGEWNDTVTITLTLPDGTEQELASTSVEEAEFTLVPGLAFNGGGNDQGDDTVGQTGFQTIKMSIPVTEGEGEYSIHISDQSDGLYDSAILIDNIRFK